MGYTAIVDYGVGNLKSIANAMDYLGLPIQITDDAGTLERADAIILPGVGAFPDAAERLRRSGLDKVLVAQAEQKPILGICLGMQLLFDMGEEVRGCKGLKLVHGRVKRIETAHKLPHIGWNSLTFQNDAPIFRGLEDGAWVYFVHSYYATDCDPAVIATTEYGAELTAAVARGNVMGCQFHPEKSGDVGLAILKTFCEGSW